MATNLSDLFRLEVVIDSTPRGIHQATQAGEQLTKSLLESFHDRGMQVRLIDPGGRGATGGELALKVVPALLRAIAYVSRKHRRQQEIEHSDETGWLLSVSLQIFTEDYEWTMARSAIVETLDALKTAEHRIRDSFGAEFCLTGLIAVFGSSNKRNIGSVFFDPGVLEDWSRSWFARAYGQVPTGKAVRIHRRPYFSTPKLSIEQGEPYPPSPYLDLKDVQQIPDDPSSSGGVR